MNRASHHPSSALPAIVALAGVLAACSAVGLQQPSADSASGAPSQSPSAAASPSPAASEPSTPVADWTGLDWGTPSSPLARIDDILPGGDGYLAFGSQQVDGVARAAVLTTADGQAWRTLYQASGTKAPSNFQDAVHVGDRYVAAGSVGKIHCFPPAGEGQRCDPAPFALWSSADLVTWDRIALMPEPLGSYWSIASAHVGDSSRAVLTGDTVNGRAAIWTSTDGMAWSAIHAGGLFADAHFDSVVAGPGGFVAGGFVGGHRPGSGGIQSTGDSVAALWQSVDGLHWARADLPDAATLGQTDLSQLSAGSEGWLAITEGTVQDSAVWRSLDGVGWSIDTGVDTTRMPTPTSSDGARIIGISYAGDEVPVVYSISSGDGTWTTLTALGDTANQPTWNGDVTASQAVVLPDGVGFLGGGPQGDLIWLTKAVTGTVPVSPTPSPGPPSPLPSPSLSSSGYAPISLASAPFEVDLRPNWSPYDLDIEGTVAVATGSEPGTLTGSAVAIVNLVTGETEYVSPALPGWVAERAVISGNHVAWTEWLFEDSRPGRHASGGALHWRIRLRDIAIDSTVDVASGVQSGYTHHWLPTPVVALDGNRIAYAIKDQSRSADRWKIVAASLGDGPTRTIRTDGIVTWVGLSGATLAYSTMYPLPRPGSATTARLTIVQGSAAPRELVATSHGLFFDPDFRDGRLAWAGISTAIGPDYVPQRIGPPENQGDEVSQEAPATGNGLVSWGSVRNGGIADSPVQLCIWSPVDGVSYEIAGEQGAEYSAIGGGWLAWTTIPGQDAFGLKATPIDQLQIPH